MSGKNIFITGSRGMLGSGMSDFLKCGNILECSEDFDITDINSVYKELGLYDIDVIIHTAAYTDVDGCEIDPDTAYKVNTIGTQNLVNYSMDKDILFIYVSSTGIYGDEKKDTPYTEFDNVNPTTVHHRSKYEAEKIIQNHLNRFLILRTGWLYGGEREHKKNFVYKRYLEAMQNDTIYSDNSQIGNPTSVIDFIRQIEILIEKGYYGIYNCVNKAENISRYDYVKKIIDFFEISVDIKVAPKGMFKRVAPVSKNESASNYKLELLGLNVMRPWEEALLSYVETLKSGI